MKIIVHGDDFGLTKGVNQGIVQACAQGVLRSTSLVACGEDFEDAINLARENPALDVGVHLTLTDEKPVNRTASGYFSHKYMPSRKILTLALATRQLDLQGVENELCAQVEKVLDAGIRPTHLDSHQFVHLLPGVFPLCMAIRQKFKIPFLRTLVKEKTSRGHGIKRALEWTMLKTYSALYVKSRIDKALPQIPCTGFLYAGGRMTSRDLMDLAGQFSRENILEIMLHPGIGDTYTARKYAHWAYDWKQDLDLCVTPGLEKSLGKRGVQVGSFRDLL